MTIKGFLDGLSKVSDSPIARLSWFRPGAVGYRVVLYKYVDTRFDRNQLEQNVLMERNRR